MSGGAVTGSGTYASGKTVSLFAAPSPGYAFLNWTDNGAIVRTSQSYTFEINADHSAIANYALTYSVSASSLPVSGGSVTGGGICTAGSPLTLVATPSPGYIFVNWTEGTAVVSASHRLSFTVSADRYLNTNFRMLCGVLELSKISAASKKPEAAGSKLS